MSAYLEKLKDPRWQKRRLEIFERDKFACLLCGGKETTLHVHHLAYFDEPWDAPDEALETLCERCHTIRPALDMRVSEKLKHFRSKDILMLWTVLNGLGCPPSGLNDLEAVLLLAAAIGITLREGMKRDILTDALLSGEPLRDL